MASLPKIGLWFGCQTSKTRFAEYSTHFTRVFVCQNNLLKQLYA